MGVETVLANTDSNNLKYLLASRVQLTQTATLTSISAYLKKAGGNMRLAVYSDSAAKPANLLACTNAFTTVAGWNTAAVTDQTVVLQPGYYWLAFECDNNAVTIAAAKTGGTYVYKSNWIYGSFPTAFPTISGSGTWSYSIYATLAAGSSATPTPTPTPTPTTTPTAITLGNTSVLSGTDSNMANYLVAYRVGLGQAAVVKSLNIDVKTASGNMVLGLYSDASGKPGSLLAQTGAFAAVAGWNSAAVTNQSVALEPGDYWLCMEATSNTLVLAAQSSGGTHAYAGGWTYGTLPATFPTLSGTGAWQYSFYASLVTQ